MKMAAEVWETNSKTQGAASAQPGAGFGQGNKNTSGLMAWNLGDKCGPRGDAGGPGDTSDTGDAEMNRWRAVCQCT